MATYRTRDGDMIDAICWKHYGRESAVIDVMETNPKLADRGEVLQAGILIDLPNLPEPSTDTEVVRLWD